MSKRVNMSADELAGLYDKIKGEMVKQFRV
jgi:hypothetical protein